MYGVLDIQKLQLWIAQGRISWEDEITVGDVLRSRVCRYKPQWTGIKLIGQANKNLPCPPLRLRLSKYTPKAAKSILQNGGQLTAVYHTKRAMQKEARAEDGLRSFESRPRRKQDICKWPFFACTVGKGIWKLISVLCMTVYYTNPKNYGYLATDAAALREAEEAKAQGFTEESPDEVEVVELSTPKAEQASV